MRLTGIKPTGSSMHLGNELGLRVNQLREEDLVMIADAHAITNPDAKIDEWSYNLTAQLIAMGCKCRIYRQTDIVGVFELFWILCNLIHKNSMDLMHAYKAGGDSVSIGVYTYPVLQAADVIICGAKEVMIGSDQAQHLEIVRKITERLMRKYDIDIPIASANVCDIKLPGIDGRKMSKSYNNTIPVISAPNELRALAYKIKTDSSPEGSPKNHETIFEIFSAFAPADEVVRLEKLYREGIGWKAAKDMLIDMLGRHMNGRQERVGSVTREEIRARWESGAKVVNEYARGLLGKLRGAL